MTIREHPLAWRWTNPKFALLPEIILGQMHPIDPNEAALLCTHSLTFADRDGLSSDVFTITNLEAEGLSKESGCCWFRARQHNLSELVTLSWNQQTAIQTTWEVFTSYWDDFCYPSSDDVSIWPGSERWALLYHHYHRFEFGMRRAT